MLLIIWFVCVELFQVFIRRLTDGINLGVEVESFRVLDFSRGVKYMDMGCFGFCLIENSKNYDCYLKKASFNIM